jgi:Skp family chaperone for outer membrane proteins
MRTIRLIAVSVVFAAIFAVSAIAQTTASDRIGLVNWAAFEAKDGITKYANALAALDKEFEPTRAELQTMGTRYQTLAKEIETLRDQAQKGTVPVNQTTVQTKVDEYTKMERDIKFKQEDAKARYESRFNIVIGPIQNDIFKALNEFAASKGYAVIFDGAKLEQAGVLLGFNQKADVTKDFITYYNARPATTATTTTPK